jgi:hypothetical protein
MGTPNTCRDFCLSSAALERTKLMLGNSAIRKERSASTAFGYRTLNGSRRLAGAVKCVPN